MATPRERLKEATTQLYGHAARLRDRVYQKSTEPYESQKRVIDAGIAGVREELAKIEAITR